MNYVAIVVLALIGESIWETFKMTWDKGKLSIDRLGAILVCVVVAYGAGADIFELIGIPLNIPYVGMFFTGLLASRGANFIHDLYKRIGDQK